MKTTGKIIVWPAYIDSRKPRNKGRRIPRGIAVEAPKIGELVEAAKKLGLDSELIKEASLPHTWWEKTGYVIVDRKGKDKIKLLKDLAAHISSMRKKTGFKAKRK